MDPSPIVEGVQVPEPPKDAYTAKVVTREQREIIDGIREKAAQERRDAEERKKVEKVPATPRKRKATSTSTPKATPSHKKKRRDPSPSSSSEGSSQMSLYSDNNSSEFSFSQSDSESGSQSDSESDSGSSIGTPDDEPPAIDKEISNVAQSGSFGK